MRMIKNFRHFRKEPTIWGMGVKPFFLFVVILIASLMTLSSGVTVTKLIGIAFIVGVTYIVCVSILTKKGLFSQLSDEKLPKNISKYE